jgi:hypothetical protein
MIRKRSLVLRKLVIKIFYFIFKLKHRTGIVSIFTLKYALSISACPIDRFGVGVVNDSVTVVVAVAVGVGSPSFFLYASVLSDIDCDGGSSFVGLSAPHNLKLSVANRHCSIIYGIADSLMFPIICRDMSKPANCCIAI